MGAHSLVILAGGIVLGCVCCSHAEQPSGTTADTSHAIPAESSASHYVDGGDSMRFIAHDENLPPGFPMSAKVMLLKNPYEHDTKAVATGAQLFVAYNCIDCHGADGSGAMGPSFADGRWHFGGAAAEIFESIYEGRPDGMPAWGGRISNDQIWMLTAYVRSLASKDLSTENFSGKTIERTGH
jgi:cytochrome c553